MERPKEQSAVPTTIFDPKKNGITATAAYLVFKGAEQDIMGSCPPKGNIAKLYDSKGNCVREVQFKNYEYRFVKNILDPHAPKPQPTTYHIKWWKAFQLGMGLTKGKPGFFIVFADKNDNYFERYRYNKETKEIGVLAPSQEGSISIINYSLTEVLKDWKEFPLDLSVVKKGEEDTKPTPTQKTGSNCLVQ